MPGSGSRTVPWHSHGSVEVMLVDSWNMLFHSGIAFKPASAVTKAQKYTFFIAPEKRVDVFVDEDHTLAYLELTDLNRDVATGVHANSWITAPLSALRSLLVCRLSLFIYIYIYMCFSCVYRMYLVNWCCMSIFRCIWLQLR